MTSPAAETWLAQQLASIPPVTGLFLGLALVVSSVGFYRVVYFISVGYAFSMVAMAGVSLLVFRDNLAALTLAQSLCLIAWGMRLGLYLLQRDFRSPSYRQQLARVERQTSTVSIPQRVLIWVAVSILYLLMFSPSLFSLLTPPAQVARAAPFFQVVGLTLMLAGLVIEGVADRQKARFKARSPTRFCDVGLYRWVRCPNYLGEIAFWVGNFVMGIAFYTTALRWGFGLVGALCIVLIMLGSTKRLELSQDERYGDDPEYQGYVRSVPVLLPFVPVYSLKKLRFYLE